MSDGVLVVDECAYYDIRERFRTAGKAGIQLYKEAISDGHPSQTYTKSLDNVHDANDQPNCDRANNCDIRISGV